MKVDINNCSDLYLVYAIRNLYVSPYLARFSFSRDAKLLLEACHLRPLQYTQHRGLRFPGQQLWARIIEFVLIRILDVKVLFRPMSTNPPKITNERREMSILDYDVIKVAYFNTYQ